MSEIYIEDLDSTKEFEELSKLLIIVWGYLFGKVGQIVAPKVKLFKSFKEEFVSTSIWDPVWMSFSIEGCNPLKSASKSSSINPGPSGFGSPEITFMSLAE